MESKINIEFKTILQLPSICVPNGLYIEIRRKLILIKLKAKPPSTFTKQIICL